MSIAHARPDFIAVANPSLVKSACVVHAEMDIPFICGPYNGQIISGYIWICIILGFSDLDRCKTKVYTILGIGITYQHFVFVQSSKCPLLPKIRHAHTQTMALCLLKYLPRAHCGTGSAIGLQLHHQSLTQIAMRLCLKMMYPQTTGVSLKNDQE